MAARVVVATAGWTIPAAVRDRFGAAGSQLERYAARLDGTEIDSSFYRPHRRTTYERWAAATPEDFRFAVKLPREITHERALVDATALLDRFLDETAGLGAKRDVVLVQLPPKRAFDAAVADAFLQCVRDRYAGRIVWEARHPSWFGDEATRVMRARNVVRVVADPPIVPDAGPASPAFAYYRLHGAPRMYYDRYSDESLARLCATLPSDRPVWIVFDNTAAGHAAANALAMREALVRGVTGRE